MQIKCNAYLFVAVLFFLTCMVCACEKESHEPATGDYPTLGDVSVVAVTSSAATFRATINSDGGSAIVEKGFCWSSAHDNPDRNDSSMRVYGSSNDFELRVSGLSANATYFVRAFAVNNTGTTYSSATKFSTDSATTGEGEGEEPPIEFVPPTYSDDYSSISNWGWRSSWNLANVHDPTVEKCGEYYYMYGTDASYGNVHVGRGQFPYRRSKDLVSWDFQGMAMSQVPAWVKDTLNNMRGRQGLAPISNPTYGCWAPVVRKVGSKYRMYYCIVVDNYIASGKQNTSANFDNSWTERAFIGLMETDDLGSNLWEDKGMVVCSSTDRGLSWSRPSQNNWDGYFKWNAIDPSFIITPAGEHWLIYGSWHSGIVALQLNPETGKPAQPLGEPWVAATLPSYGSLIYTRNNSSRWQGSEAPEVIYNEETGYYYLFLAYDELSVAYNTRVCRSQSINGPYLGFNGSAVSGRDCQPILTHPYKFNNHSGWVGISHCCIFKGDDGSWYYCSQGRLPANTNGNPYSNAIMMGHVRKIRWTEDGWPVVMPERYAAVPNTAIKESDLIGEWEHINLSYSYQKQKTAVALTLSADKKATGALSGTWSWNAETKVLTIGSQKLYVEREVDWEANPRVPTLVYAGFNSSGVSLWGKKVQ